MKKMNLLSLGGLSALFLLPAFSSVQTESAEASFLTPVAVQNSVYEQAFAYPKPDSYYLILYNVPVNATAAGGTFFIPVQSNTYWSVSGVLPGWITLSGDTGSGNGTITVTVAPNTTNAARWSTFMISGDNVAPYPFDVNQSK